MKTEKEFIDAHNKGELTTDEILEVMDYKKNLLPHITSAALRWYDETERMKNGLRCNQEVIDELGAACLAYKTFYGLP